MVEVAEHQFGTKRNIRLVQLQLIPINLHWGVQEDLQRGYFDDFREFRDKQGKIFAGQAYAPGKAPVFPQVQGEAPDGSPVSLPLSPDQANVTLVAVAFRAGAQVSGDTGSFLRVGLLI